MLFDGYDSPTVAVELDLGGIGIFTLGVSELGGSDVMGVATPNWSALPATDVRSVSTRRGRTREDQAMQSGSVTVTLDNRSGNYDPGNPSSTYVWNHYSVLARGLPLRVRAAMAVRTNLVDNPSLETDVAGWLGATRCTIARSTADSFSGAASMLITATGVGIDMLSDSGHRPAVTAGVTYTASVYIKPGIGAASVRPRIGWVDSGGTRFATTDGTSTPLPAGAWTRLAITGVAPAGAVMVQIWLQSSANASGDTWYADGFLFEAATAAGPYFDGDTDGYEWSSTPHASAARTASYVLFRGFVEKVLPDQSLDPVTTITATDALAWLATKTIPEVDPPIYSGDSTAARAARILDAVGWSSTARQLTGALQMRDTKLGDSALALLERVALCEAGRVYASRNGDVVLTTYQAVFATPIQLFFSDDRSFGTIEYDKITTSPGAEYLVNKVRLTMAEDAAATYADGGSIARFGEFSRQVNAPLLNEADATVVAQAIVDRNAYPQTRVDRIEFDALGLGSSWPSLLRSELGDRTSVTRDPVDDRPPRTYTCVIESLNHNITPTGWRVDLDMSAASASTYFVLGSSVLGGPDKLYY